MRSGTTRRWRKKVGGVGWRAGGGRGEGGEGGEEEKVWEGEEENVISYYCFFNLVGPSSNTNFSC